MVWIFHLTKASEKLNLDNSNKNIQNSKKNTEFDQTTWFGEGWVVSGIQKQFIKINYVQKLTTLKDSY